MGKRNKQNANIELKYFTLRKGREIEREREIERDRERGRQLKDKRRKK